MDTIAIISLAGTIASLVFAFVAMHDSGRKHSELSSTLAAICRHLLGDTGEETTEVSDDDTPSAWMPQS